MAKSPAEQYREVTNALSTLSERVENIRRDVERNNREVDDAYKFREQTLDALSKLGRDHALLSQRLDDHLKRVEIWDARRWSLIVLQIGAVFSLASGLIVTLAKK